MDDPKAIAYQIRWLQRKAFGNMQSFIINFLFFSKRFNNKP